MSVSRLQPDQFINASPQAPSKKEQSRLLNLGQRDNTVALEVQFRIHSLLNNPGLQIENELYNQLRNFQSLAFAGYHPSTEELIKLQD